MTNSTSALSKIEELQKQIETLKQQAVEEVKHKLSDARKIVSQLESELAELSGKPREEEEMHCGCASLSKATPSCSSVRAAGRGRSFS